VVVVVVVGLVVVVVVLVVNLLKTNYCCSWGCQGVDSRAWSMSLVVP